MLHVTRRQSCESRVSLVLAPLQRLGGRGVMEPPLARGLKGVDTEESPQHLQQVRGSSASFFKTALRAFKSQPYS